MPNETSDPAVLTQQQVQARLCRPPSKNLDVASWRVARPSLIELVTAMQPTSETAAVRFHSHLCDFLRRSPWELGVPLDFHQLITSEAIDRHGDEQKKAGVGRSLLEGHRSTLHRAQRALAGEEPDYRASRPSKSAVPTSGNADQAVRIRLAMAAAGTTGIASTVREAFRNALGQGGLAGTGGLLPARVDLLLELGLTPALLQRLTLHALLDTECSVVEMAAALAPQAEMTAERLNVALRRLAACGAAVGTGTVADVHLQRMTSAAARDVKEIPLPEKSTPPMRPPSRAALQRAARAEMDTVAARCQLLDPCQPLPVNLDVAPDVKAKILTWSPARHNRTTPEALAPVRALLVRLVLASEPTSSRAVALCGHLAGFLVWVGERHPGGPSALRAEHLWDDQLLQDYRLYQLRAPDGPATVHSADTARSAIRWVLHRARPSARREPTPPRTVAAPYTAAEAARLVRQARNQPTDVLRRSLSFIVALALGAGLDGQDLRYVRRSDIKRHRLDDGQTILVVTVRHPERPREVVVLRAYEALLLEALDLHRAARLHRDASVIGEKPTRKNITSPIKARAQTGSGAGVDLDVGRMRKHWLATCMTAAVPLPHLLRAAGLTSTRALTDLLPFLSPPDPERVHEVLREATDRMLATPATGGSSAAPEPSPPAPWSAGPASGATPEAELEHHSAPGASRATLPTHQPRPAPTGEDRPPPTARRRPPAGETGRPRAAAAGPAPPLGSGPRSPAQSSQAQRKRYPPSSRPRSSPGSDRAPIAPAPCALTDSPAARGCTEPRGPPTGAQPQQRKQRCSGRTLSRGSRSSTSAAAPSR